MRKITHYAEKTEMEQTPEYDDNIMGVGSAYDLFASPDYCVAKRVSAAARWTLQLSWMWNPLSDPLFTCLAAYINWIF